MQMQTVDVRQLIESYVSTLCAQPKTDEVVDRFVSDPMLKEHIRQAEKAFPGYVLTPEQIIVEGDTAAMRAIMRGTHRGEFAGMPATGREVTAGVMLFYRVADGRIAEHWMQLDTMAIMSQLTS